MGQIQEPTQTTEKRVFPSLTISIQDASRTRSERTGQSWERWRFFSIWAKNFQKFSKFRCWFYLEELSELSGWRIQSCIGNKNKNITTCQVTPSSRKQRRWHNELLILTGNQREWKFEWSFSSKARKTSTFFDENHFCSSWLGWCRCFRCFERPQANI